MTRGGPRPDAQDGLAVAQWRVLYPPSGTVPRWVLTRHLLALGETGSGKSESVILPLLAALIWQTLDPIERMQAQLRCLGHRLIAAANVYAGTAQLDAVVQAIVAQPVGTLAELLESDHDEETALVVYSGVRLLYCTFEVVREHAPEVVDTLARLSTPERADAGMLDAAQRIRADAERFAIGPAKPSPSLARDPVVARVEEMVRSRFGPPRGVPDDLLDYLAMLREG